MTNTPDIRIQPISLHTVTIVVEVWRHTDRLEDDELEEAITNGFFTIESQTPLAQRTILLANTPESAELLSKLRAFGYTEEQIAKMTHAKPTPES